MGAGKRKRNPLAALCSGLGTLLLVLLAAACLPLTAPRLLGYEIFTVVSGSMAPAIPTGSLVYIEGAHAADMEEGDVIAFYGGADASSIITHRVVENHTLVGEFITKGDANAEADVNPVPYADFIGKVCLSVPRVGRAAQYLTGRKGKIAAACVIAASLLLEGAAALLRRERA